MLDKGRHLFLNALEQLNKQRHQPTAKQLRFHSETTITYVVDGFSLTSKTIYKNFALKGLSLVTHFCKEGSQTLIKNQLSQGSLHGPWSCE